MTHTARFWLVETNKYLLVIGQYNNNGELLLWSEHQDEEPGDITGGETSDRGDDEEEEWPGDGDDHDQTGDTAEEPDEWTSEAEDYAPEQR